MTVRFSQPQKPVPATTKPRSFASFRAIAALMLREMSTTYGRTPGGYIWAILEPVAGIAILTFTFSFLFHSPAIGTSFELFYATGLLPFLMATTLTNKIGNSLLFSKPLLAYPAVTFVDALVARFLVNFATELLVFYIVMAGIIMFYDTRAMLDIAKVAEAIALAALFGLSLGTLNAFLFMRFHLWHVAWALISRPLFMISGVFFIFNSLPPGLRDYLWFNPYIHIVGIMRSGFYPTYDATYASPLYVILVSLALGVSGLLLLRKDVKRLLFER